MTVLVHCGNWQFDFVPVWTGKLSEQLRILRAQACRPEFILLALHVKVGPGQILVTSVL